MHGLNSAGKSRSPGTDTDPTAPAGVPVDRPSVARMYDYYLGGAHNFAVDREAAQRVIQAYPDLPRVIQANRAFLRRAVTFLVGRGIDQFLDVGSGIPTAGNVHEVVQRLNPEARVVYVDNDPTAVAHSRVILDGNPRAGVFLGDARAPEELLAHPEVVRLLDLRRPVAVLLVSLLHFIPDNAEAQRVVRVLREAVPAGSYVALVHASAERLTNEVRAQIEAIYARAGSPFRFRTRDEIARFFEGLELVEPGLVYLPLWHPDSAEEPFFHEPERSTGDAGVGRKP